MDCRRFEALLESLLDREVDPVTREDCLDHAAECGSCADLLRPGLEALVAATAVADSRLVDSILRHTDSRPCPQARDLLPALIESQLASDDGELVGLHLQHCPECKQLLEILTFLQRELPQLAETPPDDRFTDDVLAATLSPGLRLRRWWRGRWTTWVHRPRFAMEAAYLGLVVILLVLGAFSTPLAALPLKGLELIQPDTGETTVWTEANASLGTFWSQFASLLENDEAESKTTEETP